MPAQAQLKPHKVNDSTRVKKWMLRIPPLLSESGKREKMFFQTKGEASAKARSLKPDGRKFKRLTLEQIRDYKEVKKRFKEFKQRTGSKVTFMEVMRVGIEEAKRNQENVSKS